MLTLPEHLISMEVHVVLSFVSLYFMLQSCLLMVSCLTAWYLYFLLNQTLIAIQIVYQEQVAQCTWITQLVFAIYSFIKL